MSEASICVFLLVVEGIRAFQLSFAPLLVKRSRELQGEPVRGGGGRGGEGGEIGAGACGRKAEGGSEKKTVVELRNITLNKHLPCHHACAWYVLIQFRSSLSSTTRGLGMDGTQDEFWSYVLLENSPFVIQFTCSIGHSPWLP